jgi:putative endonuclease
MPQGVLVRVQFRALMFFVYALRSETRNYIYVGLTSNIARRIKEHNLGYERTTKPYAPFRLLLVEELATRFEARNREKYLKSGKGKEFLKLLP